MRPSSLVSTAGFTAFSSLVVLALGCGPDVEARYQEFLDESQPIRFQGVGDPCFGDAEENRCLPGLICKDDVCSECSTDEECDPRTCTETEDETTGETLNLCTINATYADVSGRYLLALSTVVSYELPLQFLTEATLTDNPDGGGGTLRLELQPLSLDQASTTSPREPVGEVIIVEVEVDADGLFSADLGTLMVTGEANPITGGDIVTTAILEGAIKDEMFFCGGVTGMVTAPIPNNLEPSFFAVTRLPDNAVAPDDLPLEFPVRCPEDE